MKNNGVKNDSTNFEIGLKPHSNGIFLLNLLF